MPFFDEGQFNKHIKEDKFARLYLIYGEESYLKNHYVKTLAGAAVGTGFEDFNLHRFDADNEKKQDTLTSLLASIFEACSTVPIMSRYTCTIVKDFPISALTKENLPLFEAGISQIPETSILIFYMERTEVSNKKTDKWYPILAQCAKIGVCAELNGRSANATASLIVAGAKKRGCTISPETAQYFIRYCKDDLQILLNELDKLCAFTGSGEITEESIVEVCVKSVEASVFDLAKCIVEQNADDAYSILATLLSQKTEPTIILGTLASAYVDIYRVKAAAAESRSTRELANLFSYKGKTFRLEQAAKLARRLSLQKAKQCIAILSDADIGIKFSSKPNSLILEELLAKLLRV